MAKFQLDPVQFVIYFGILNTMILSALLFFSKKNQRADKWLALLLLGITLDLFSHTLISRLFKTYQGFTLEYLSIIYALGPLIWLYVVQLTVVDFSLQKRHIWYFIPFFLDTTYTLCKALYIRLFAVDDKMLYYSPDYPSVQLEFLIHDGLAIGYGAFFLAFGFAHIKRHRQSLKQHLSSTKNVDLRWLRIILIALLSLLLAWAGYHLVEISIYPAYLNQTYYYPFWVVLILIVLVLGYQSLLQPLIPLDNPDSSTDSIQNPKYRSSRLSDSALMDLAQNLRHSVESEKLYLNPSLRLADLCKASGLTTHTISQVLSQGLSLTFYDFINAYRVEEVKRLMQDKRYEHMKLIALAFDAGFNSKTAFYEAFKKHAQMSPSQFRKNLIAG